jgi:hypothetical protein
MNRVLGKPGSKAGGEGGSNKAQEKRGSIGVNENDQDLIETLRINQNLAQQHKDSSE